MELFKKSRATERTEKRYKIFCRSQGRSSIAESIDISEKGLKMVTDAEFKVGDTVEMKIIPTDEIFSVTFDGKVVWAKEADELESELRYHVGVQFLEGSKDLTTEHLLSGHKNTQSLIIDASQKACYDAICNFESYPSWQKVVKEVKVLERGKDGRPVIVDFRMDLIFRIFRIVNRYEYLERDFILSWKAVDGDLKVNEGTYIFQELRENRTNAIFSAHVELGFFAPKRIINYVSNVTMRKSMRALKEVAEKGLV